MILKNTKTILFASLIVAMILPFSGMNFAEAKEDEVKTKQDFKNDVKKWLKDTDEDKKSLDDKTDELKTTYNTLLRESIKDIRIETNTKNLVENEIQNAISYISYEIIKDEKLKIVDEKQSANTLEIDFLRFFGVQLADAYCTTTHPSYEQLVLDINGGTYDQNYFNGGNDLYLVSYFNDSDNCERTYTLYFTDEDHPYLDSFYDEVRLQWLHRTYDIESFTIINNNQIEFDTTWSSSNDYDCLTWYGTACHNTATVSYTPGQTIYVSNTWNHMMNTIDTNTSLSKVSVP